MRLVGTLRVCLTSGPFEQAGVLIREPICNLLQERCRNRNSLFYFIYLHLESSAVLAVSPIAQGVQFIELVLCEPGSALSF